MSRLLKLNPNFKPAFDGNKIAMDLIFKLSHEYPVIEVYFFGSAAAKKNTKNSDVDLLVVIPDSSDLKKYHDFVNTPFFSPVAVDWIIEYQSDFETKKNTGGVCRVAYLTGKKIFPVNSSENEKK